MCTNVWTLVPNDTYVRIHAFYTFSMSLYERVLVVPLILRLANTRLSMLKREKKDSENCCWLGLETDVKLDFLGSSTNENEP